MSASGYSGLRHPIHIVLHLIPHFEDAVGILINYAFEDGLDFSLDCVGGVDRFDGIPHVVMILLRVIPGEEEVFADFDTEVDGFMMGVCVPVRFQGGNSRVYVGVPVGVSGAEEVFSVFNEDVPDDDSILDGSVFLVEESSVEEVPFVGVQLEGFG